MGTIKYDYPVRNLIAGLNKTGHVTHTKHRKSSVTLHHNAGRLSLQGILDVWKKRPASAHFQVDGVGNVGQYVNVNEYAWATGTTKGNQESISIEMANSRVGGNWPVAQATWHTAARLAAWLHWKVIGHAPTRNSLKVHHDWKPTTCAGPFIDEVYPQLLRLSRWWYAQFVKGTAKPKQAVKKPAPSRPSGRKSNTQIANEVLAGQWGNGEERKRRLTAAGYNYRVIQNVVNSRIGRGAPHAEPKKSITRIAHEVIAGEWGNGSVRRQRLEGAGYNYRLVQNEVNRLLR